MGFGSREYDKCLEHGFALSPEGTCIRCVNEAARAARRARRVRLALGGIFLVSLLGFGAARARMRTKPVAVQPAPGDGVVAAPASSEPVVTERAVAETASETPRRPPRAGRVENLPSSVDHPSWWQDQQPIPARPRGSIAAQQRAMTAAGVAPPNVTNPGAWLPPNNGGNFTTR